MKEYIEKTLYDASGLTIGLTSGRHSIMFHRGKETVILGTNEFSKVIKQLSNNKLSGDYGDFSFSLKQKGIVFTQNDNNIYVDRDVFAEISGR